MDMTHLQFLPSPSDPLSSESSNPTTKDTPSLLLLSASYDGIVSLTYAKVVTGDDALYGSGTLDGCFSQAGWYRAMVGKRQQRRQDIKIWARSVMDSIGTWTLGRGIESDLAVGGTFASYGNVYNISFPRMFLFCQVTIWSYALVARSHTSSSSYVRAVIILRTTTVSSKPRTRLGKKLPSVDDS